MYLVSHRMFHFIICLLVSMAMMLGIYYGLNRANSNFSNYFNAQTTNVVNMINGKNNSESNFDKTNNNMINKIGKQGGKGNQLTNRIANNKSVKILKNGK